MRQPIFGGGSPQRIHPEASPATLASSGSSTADGEQQPLLQRPDSTSSSLPPARSTLDQRPSTSLLQDLACLAFAAAAVVALSALATALRLVSLSSVPAAASAKGGALSAPWGMYHSLAAGVAFGCLAWWLRSYLREQAFQEQLQRDEREVAEEDATATTGSSSKFAEFPLGSVISSPLKEGPKGSSAIVRAHYLNARGGPLRKHGEDDSGHEDHDDNRDDNPQGDDVMMHMYHGFGANSFRWGVETQP